MGKKKHNPNSRKCLRRDPSNNSWSELPQDLLYSVFERLSFANFRRAKSVCTSWYSASRQSVPQNQIPWLILFPEDDDNNNSSCTLFNPEVKDKLYKTKDMGLEFTKSVCMAIYGNWIFMRDRRYNFYIVNIFTNERVNLPPVESQLGPTKIERTLDDEFRISNDHDQRESRGIDIGSPLFWIDEETKDYVVLWGLSRRCVVYAKKGDTSWTQIPETSYSVFFDMAYKDHKLHFLSCWGSFKIFHFFRETFQCSFIVDSLELIFELFQPSTSWIVGAPKLVVTVIGDVLKVEPMVNLLSKIWLFRVYKVYSSGLLKKCEKVDSLGDEAMLYDRGITVLANDIEGFKKNSIYFSGSHDNNRTEICLFNLETQKMEQLHKFDSSLQQLASAQWFLPSFKRK